jgi:hypothetical protein
LSILNLHFFHTIRGCKRPMKTRIFFIVFLMVAYFSYGQKVTNVKAELIGTDVKITFDLTGKTSADLFEVRLFASHNNFTEPLKMISGSAGKSIKPGNNLSILWKAKEELVNFKGEITFEVRATLMGGYYIVSNPSSTSKFKKGKLLPINWNGGEPGEKVKIELVKSNVVISTISESVGNQGSYIWTIPKSTKPSKEYQVRITNTSDVDSKGLSKAFRVKGKSAAPYILVPLVLAGGAGAYVATQGGGTGPVTPPTETLPTPPNPQ